MARTLTIRCPFSIKWVAGTSSQIGQLLKERGFTEVLVSEDRIAGTRGIGLWAFFMTLWGVDPLDLRHTLAITKDGVTYNVNSWWVTFMPADFAVYRAEAAWFEEKITGCNTDADSLEEAQAKRKRSDIVSGFILTGICIVIMVARLIVGLAGFSNMIELPD